MQNIGIGHEIIKNLRHESYTKEGFLVVDDLFTLSLPQCLNSKLQFCLICEELITSEVAKRIMHSYMEKCTCYSISQKVFEVVASKQNCVGMILVTALEKQSFNLDNESFVLICDGLENSGNIGTIFRTADASSVPLIIFTNMCARINDPKVIHASRGTIFTVPYIELPTVVDCVKFLQERNFRIAICEPEQGECYRSFKYSKSLAVVVGSERYGVDVSWFSVPNIEYMCIPMQSKVGSLNVGVAASIIMYEAQIAKNKIEIKNC